MAALLLQSGSWHSIFYFGAACSALFLPLAWFVLPETVHFHVGRQGSRSLAEVNAVLDRFGHAPVAALPPVEPGASGGLSRLFAPAMLRQTLCATFLYFGHILTFYFAMKWMVKLLVDSGYHPSEAAWLLVVTNLAGIIGGAVFGLAARRIALRRLALFVLLGSSASVAAFGYTLESGGAILPVVILIGIFINCGVVACYAVLADVFPPEVRASGSGIVLGVGRFAAILAPVMTGQLLAIGASISFVSLLLAGGSILGVAAMLMLRTRQRRFD